MNCRGKANASKRRSAVLCLNTEPKRRVSTISAKMRLSDVYNQIAMTCFCLANRVCTEEQLCMCRNDGGSNVNWLGRK